MRWCCKNNQAITHSTNLLDEYIKQSNFDILLYGIMNMFHFQLFEKMLEAKMKVMSSFSIFGKYVLLSLLIIALLISTVACDIRGTEKSSTGSLSAAGESASQVPVSEAASPEPFFSYKTLDFISSDADQVYLNVKDTLLFGENIAFLVTVYDVSQIASGDTTSSTDDFLLIYDSDGRQTASINTSSFSEGDAKDSSVLGLIPCNNNSISILIEKTVSNDVDLNRDYSTKLCTISAMGELLSSFSYADKEISCDKSQVDSEGNIYCIACGLVTIFDSKMNVLSTITDESILPFAYNINGVVYVMRSKIVGTAAVYELTPILPAEKALGKNSTDITKYINAGYTFQQGTDGIYAVYSDGLYKFDMTTGSASSVFSFTDTDYARYSNGKDETLIPFSKDTFFVCGIDRSGTKDTAGLVLLTREDKNPNAGKTILTVGGINTAKDASLQAAVSLFNQTNTKFRVEIVDYASDMNMYGETSDYNEMNSNLRTAVLLKIMSGGGTDILYDDSGNPLQTSAAQNSQVDLMPYIEKDPDINSDNYLINVITALKSDEKLYQIISNFSVIGLAGANSKVGQKTGWTYDEFHKFADSLPTGVTPILKDWSQGDLLAMAIDSNMEQFIDFSSSGANFDTDDFRYLLDFAKNNGINPDDPGKVYENMYQPLIDGTATLLAREITGPKTYNDIEKKIFNESFSMMGFPSSLASGPSINPSSVYSISSDCKYKDAAWEFIKTVLSEKSQEALSGGIPVNKKTVETQIQKAMNIKAVDVMDTNYGVKPMDEETAARYRDVLLDLSNVYLSDSDINAILKEEANAYFYGQKSAADVTLLIQNRLQTLLFERK